MTFSFGRKTSDTWGALASGLCLIHCLATPFIFAAHAGAAAHDHHHESPFWWGLIDSVLLVVSFLAVVWSARNSSRQWVKVALFLSWAVLAGIILNEKFGWLHLPEALIYLPAVSLVGLHLYNRRYCQCEDETCCANPDPSSKAV